MCFPAARPTSPARTAPHAAGSRSPSAGSAAPISYPAGGRCHTRASRPSGPRQRYRSRAQVVGDEYGLAIEQEAAVARVRLQPLEQVIQRGDEPRLKRGARQIPLAVPMGVRDEMKDEPAHWRVSLRGLRLPCYTLHYKVLLDTGSK